jgi:hypothetical protein
VIFALKSGFGWRGEESRKRPIDTKEAGH